MSRRIAMGLICIAVFALAAVPLFAQERIDVVYLKNGSIIRGTIIEQVPNESIKIETADGSVYVFKMSEVEKITREAAPQQTRPAARPAEPMAPVYLVINPLGILQFGPMIDLEFRVTQKLYGFAHVRFQGIGLLAHILAVDDMSYLSTAVGGGIRYFFPRQGSPNAPYVGLAAEVGYNPYSGNAGYTDSYHGRSVYLTFAGNGGYRWRFEKFIVNVGGYIGVAPTVYSQWSYDATPTLMQSGTLDTTFVAMAEVSIGWGL